jgi:uncharacterized coiled-coil DUF342 family protein
LAASEQNVNYDNIDTLGWDQLVSLRRTIFSHLKELTDKIIDIKNRLHELNESIRSKKEALELAVTRSRDIRGLVRAKNSEFLGISQKISQSKDFLKLVDSRIAAESEETLVLTVNTRQKTLAEKKYKNEREKIQLHSEIKDASMKLEAIKATRAIKDQLVQLNSESERFKEDLNSLDYELSSLANNALFNKNTINTLFQSKRQLVAERDRYMARYDEALRHLDSINSRLDIMSETRKKQRGVYGSRLADETLLKVREQAERKLKSGSKLTLEELKLLYNENV